MAEIDRILASTHSESIEIMTRVLVAFVCRKEIIWMEHDTLYQLIEKIKTLVIVISKPSSYLVDSCSTIIPSA